MRTTKHRLFQSDYILLLYIQTWDNQKRTADYYITQTARSSLYIIKEVSTNIFPSITDGLDQNSIAWDDAWNSTAVSSYSTRFKYIYAEQVANPEASQKIGSKQKLDQNPLSANADPE